MTSPTPRSTNHDTVIAAEAAGAPTYGSYPLRLTLEITADCNLYCPGCEFTPPRAWAKKNDPGRILHVGIEDLRRFAAAVFPHIMEVVPTATGEPLMYPHWDEFLELCRQYGVALELITNASYFDETTLPPLEGVLSHMIVSMDGASRETFNVLRKPSDLDDIVGRLHKVREWRAGLSEETRPSVAIHSVLSLVWVDELPAMVRLAKDCGVDALSIGHIISFNDYWKKQHPQMDPVRTDRALRAAREEAERIGITVRLPRLFEGGEDVSFAAPPAFPLKPRIQSAPAPADRKYWCKYLWRELFIALDGTVAPCCGPGRPDVDNVNRNPDLQAMFDHPILADMRKGMVSGDLHAACAKCPQLSMFGALDYAASDFTDTYDTLYGELEKQKAAGKPPA